MNKVKVLLILSVFISFSCKSHEKEKPVVTAEASLSAEEDEGALIYKKFCLSCHQSDGTGVPGFFPPLVNTSWVKEDKERLIKIVLQGLSGEIEVNSEVYSNTMPPQYYLTDEQISEVLTYIRGNFQNNASPVSAEEVQKVRNSLSE